MEHAFEQLAGVVDVESGYCGGTKATANYDAVHLGTTAHAEALLQDAGLTSKRRKARRDMLAAQILLAAYLESGRSNEAPRGLEDRT